MKRTDTKSTDWIAFERLPSEILIEAGIFQEKGAERKKGRKAAKLSLLEIAACHEFGALLKDATGEVIGEIPQRSFLRAWFDANEEKVQAAFVRRLSQEGPENWAKALNQVALWIEAELKRNVRKGGTPPFEPLKEATKERKKSTKPLIDTGQLVNAIMAKVDGKIPS
jgi:hypothetical protein